jgi:hypothetical protein
LWICAVAFLVTGAAFTIVPERMFEGVGLTLANGSPVTELRAVYGGLEIAIGLFLAVCARRRGFALELGLLLSFLLFGALAIYRAIGMGIDGPQLPLMPVLLLLEAGGTLLALSGLLLLGRAPASID